MFVLSGQMQHLASDMSWKARVDFWGRGYYRNVDNIPFMIIYIYIHLIGGFNPSEKY